MSTQQNAFGNFLFSRIQRGKAPYQTPYGVMLGPATSVAAYVRSTGVQDGDDTFVQTHLVTTLNQALLRVRAGLGDVVYVLPGHAENISTADQMSGLRAGTSIIGVGEGNNRPTFTWSAAAATFLFDKANVSIDNCILEMAGDPTSTTALSVAAPITVSAAGCSINGCKIRVSVDADQLATIPITTTVGADDFSINGCEIFGATAGEVTTVVALIGADRCVISGTTIQAATSAAAVGVVRMSGTASLNCVFADSDFINRKALSSSAVTGFTASSGIAKRCNFGILDTATLAGFTVPELFQMFGCKTANLAGESGADTAPVST